jgi:predicted phage terminase large subunit-like protein
MKPATWEQIIRPALADVKGGALFIGTPKGRNAFYEMYKYGQSGKDKDWTSFHFTSLDNPLIPPEEVEAARMSMSSFAFKQEFMAAFEAASSDLFKEEWVIIEEKEPKEGSYYIAIDLAGFEDVASQAMNKKKLLDETAIAVVKVTDEGNWYVKELIHGRWDIKETANEILKAVSKYEPNAVGIEKGSLKNAVMPYLTDLMRKYNKYFRIDEVTHGNRKKIDRVVWSLQGRFEHGRITLCEGLWNNEFIDQLLNFPNPQMHDDLVDALAYVDQVAVVTYADTRDFEDSWEPLDAITGY